MSTSVFDRIVDAAVSSSAKEREFAISNLITLFGKDYSQMYKVLKPYLKSGKGGEFFEFLVKNVCMVLSYEEIQVWNGKAFVRPTSFLSKTGSEKANSDFLFKDSEGYTNTSSKTLSRGSTSVSNLEMSEELTKVVDKIIIDNGGVRPNINGIAVIHNKVSKIGELARRAKNSGYNYVKIICINDILCNNVDYVKKFEEFSHMLSFIPFSILWERFVDVMKKTFNNDFNLLFKYLSKEIKTYVPRVHQMKIAEQCAYFLKRNKRVGISALCRFGKTYTTALAIKMLYGDNLAGRTIVLLTYFPKNYEDQIKDFRRVFGDVNISARNAEGFEFDSSMPNVITLSTQYTHSNEVKESVKEWLSKADIVVYDEAHIGFGTVKQDKVLSYIPENCKTIVVSATPNTESLNDITFFSFTDYDRFMCDVNGDKSYYNNPNVINLELTTIYDENTKEKYSWNSCSELFEGDVRYIALTAVVERIINMGYSGISIDKFRHNQRVFSGNYSLYNDEPSKRYLRNISVYVGERKHTKTLMEVLEALREKWAKKCEINFKFSLSDAKYAEFEHFMEYYESDSIQAVNNMFKRVANEDGLPVLNFYICVDMNTTGCTINNGDAVVKLFDGTSFNNNEQRDGRVKERTYIKNYKARENDYSHYTFSIDCCPNRQLNMFSNRLSYDEEGNIIHTDKSIEYYSTLCGSMTAKGELILPSYDEMVHNIVMNHIGGLMERIGVENAYKILGIKSNDVSKFNLTNFNLHIPSSRGVDILHGIVRKEVSYNEEIISNEIIEEKELTKEEVNDITKKVKKLASWFLIMSTRCVCTMMSDEMCEKVVNREINAIDAIDMTLKEYGVVYVSYCE